MGLLEAWRGAVVAISASVSAQWGACRRYLAARDVVKFVVGRKAWGHGPTATVIRVSHGLPLEGSLSLVERVCSRGRGVISSSSGYRVWRLARRAHGALRERRAGALRIDTTQGRLAHRRGLPFCHGAVSRRYFVGSSIRVNVVVPDFDFWQNTASPSPPSARARLNVVRWQ